MANAQRPIVNQRLYFCRLHLDWLSEQLAQQRIAKSVLQQCLGESVQFHLVLAYRAYLAEIAVAYNLSSINFADASDLAADLSAQGLESAEAKELQQLESAGWLSELLAYHRSIGPLQAPVRQPRASQVISFADVSADGVLDLACCQSYYQSLNQIIENQRERLEEW